MGRAFDDMSKMDVTNNHNRSDNLKSATLPIHDIYVSKIRQNKPDAYKFIAEYFNQNKIEPEDLSIFINKIFDLYTNSYLLDSRMSFNDTKVELKKFIHYLNKITSAIEPLDGVVFNTIFDFEISHRDKIPDVSKNTIGEITIFRLNAIKIKSIADRILETRNKKIPINRVYEACIIIIDFYEIQKGKRFIHNLYAPVGSKAKDSTDRQFKNPDAQFVKKLMEIVDPKLKFEMIQTGLKRALMDRKKLGRNPNE